MTSTGNIDEGTPQSDASRGSSPTHEMDEEANASLRSILIELRDFRRDNKQQLADIKQELHRTNNRLDEAEDRIKEAETALQATITQLKRLSQRQASMEAKLIDQEGRARRDNIRFYGIPEEAEGNNISAFLENLLKESVDFPPDTELKIERAHRALVSKPADPQSKPRSIIAKFASYKTKEEVIRKVWQKREVFYNNTRFYVDHDYPSTILKRRIEYAEVRKILKERKIKFQTPYPARLRVFYSNGTRLYQSAAEATEDMALRGFPVTIIPAPTSPDHREFQLLSTWQEVKCRRGGAPDTTGTALQGKRASQMQYREKLQEFKRRSPADE